MILYLAGIYASNQHLTGNLFRRFNDREKEARRGVKHILESYHYVHSARYVENMRRDGTRVFLDSGAFSAYTLGKHIDLSKYCGYIKDNADLIVCASVLDGIGDPQKTWDNQVAMHNEGTAPLPCFHYGEDPRWLQWYIKHYSYITIGGMVPIAKPQLRLWLDDIWAKYLTDANGMPKVRVHGFGLTTVELMQRYPWYSVDSSTWVQRARTGAIHIPGIGDVSISQEAPQAREAMRHFDTCAPVVQDTIRFEIERRGFDVQRLRTTYLARWAFNMVTYPELSNPDAPPKPFKTGIQTFF